MQGNTFNSDLHANVGRRLAGGISTSSGDLESEQSPLQSKRSSMFAKWIWNNWLNVLPEKWFLSNFVLIIGVLIK